MAESVQDQAARDDAHLRSLGIKPELRRTLGFLSNFAVAFSFISVSTGTFTATSRSASGRPGRRSSGRGRSSSSARLIVALELRRAGEPLPGRGLDLPVVEAPLEPDARLVHRLVLLLGRRRHGHRGRGHRAAFVVDGIHGANPEGQTAFLDSPDPTGLTTMFTVHRLVDALAADDADQRVRRPAAVDHQQHRRRRRDPRHARLRADPPVLREPPVAGGPVRHAPARETAPDGQYLPVFALGMFMALFVVYGFDTAGTFGEETIDASRQAPRGVLSAIWLSGLVGAVFLLAVILVDSRTWARRSRRARRSGSRSPTTIKQNLTYDDLGRDHARRPVPVRDPRRGLRLHPGDPGRDDPADVLDGPRPAPARSAAIWGHVNSTFKTPANAAIAVGVLAAIPFFVTGAGGAI